MEQKQGFLGPFILIGNRSFKLIHLLILIIEKTVCYPSAKDYSPAISSSIVLLNPQANSKFKFLFLPPQLSYLLQQHHLLYNGVIVFLFPMVNSLYFVSYYESWQPDHFTNISPHIQMSGIEVEKSKGDRFRTWQGRKMDVKCRISERQWGEGICGAGGGNREGWETSGRVSGQEELDT